MAKTTNNTIDRTQLDRYRPIRTVGMKATVSFSDRGSLAISADLMASWPAGRSYGVIYASKDRKFLFIEPAGPDDVGSLKLPRDGCGSAKANGKAAIHQFGLDAFAGSRRCPARWADGLIVASIVEATSVPRRAKSRVHAKTQSDGELPSSSGWVGQMKCPDCCKEVAYRIVAGCRVTRKHNAPDGVPCGGVVDDGD
jgi:hypothetical protein